MESKLHVHERLIVHILDSDGNIIETKEYRPPTTPIEKIAAKLGILKRTNTVNTSGLNVAAKRWVGVTQDPVTWIGAKRSGTSTWDFKAADVYVSGDKAYIRNPSNMWDGGVGYTWSSFAGAYSNAATAIVSEISGVAVILEQSNEKLWVEIEYDFNAS